MTWPFCNQCGSVLEPPVADYVTCDYCGYHCKFQDINVGEVITHSAIRARPAWVGEEDVAEHEHGSSSSSTGKPAKKVDNKHAVIEEPCPKCGHHEQYFYTMQLRSVDEGSTVFYECPRCNNKYSVNN